MRSSVFLFTASCLLSINSGCGTVVLKQVGLKYSVMGTPSFGHESNIRQEYSKRVEAGEIGDPSKVRILIDQIPEGISWRDGVISVDEGYSHKIIAKFTLYPKGGGFSDQFFAFPDYKSTWRKYYCYPQQPLTWITLLVWAWAVPLYYPCYVDLEYTPSQALEHIALLLSVVKGDMAVLSLKKRISNSGEEDEKVTVYHVEGFLIKMDARFHGVDVEIPTKPMEIPKSQPNSI